MRRTEWDKKNSSGSGHRRRLIKNWLRKQGYDLDNYNLKMAFGYVGKDGFRTLRWSKSRLWKPEVKDTLFFGLPRKPRRPSDIKNPVIFIIPKGVMEERASDRMCIRISKKPYSGKYLNYLVEV